MRRPVILIAADLRNLPSRSVGALPHQVLFQKYVDFVVGAVGGVPIILPASVIDPVDLRRVLSMCSGLLLPGSPSDVGARLVEGNLQSLAPHKSDHARDATTLLAIREAVARKIPVLGICRGMQEINCAFGGTLKDLPAAVTRELSHCADQERPFDQRYEVKHQVAIVRQTALYAIVAENGALEGRLYVNSLHRQAIDQLGESLCIAAVSHDGTIEAIESAGSSFCLGVQWHCEWHRSSSGLDQRIGSAYAAACLAYQKGRK